MPTFKDYDQSQAVFRDIRPLDITLSAKPDIPYIYLQFFNDILYSITIIFDERYIDYYALTRQMESKYGQYHSMNPVWREWRIDDVLIKVEKPSTVKYIALEKFLEAFENHFPPLT